MGYLQTQCVLVYIDDIKVYNSSLQQYVVNLDAVLARLKVANLKVSVSKIRPALPEILVIGHLVSALRIFPHLH